MLDIRGRDAFEGRKGTSFGTSMNFRFARAGLVIAALLLAGCTDATLDNLSPKAEKPLPDKLVQSMRAKGMTRTSPIMVRIFKEEGVLEVWKQKDNGRYDLATSYDICKWSGKLGPKFTEGDRQAPEGFYTIRPYQMNPKSSYHLAFNIGYPNSFDRAHGRTGSNLMVHGACSSAGCYSMSDNQVEQIYAFARDAFRGGQTEFQVQAFPFRMTPENMARYKDDPNFEFWSMLKEGYDHFEITKVPPKVDVCGKRYVFNRIAADGKAFSPTAACPVMVQPENLETAYRSYKTKYESAFTAALGNGASKRQPAPTIAGFKEAVLVADWSRRRARGEKVTNEPPSLQQPIPQLAGATPQPRPETSSVQSAQADGTPPEQVIAEQAAAAIAAATAGTPVPEPRPEAGSVETDPLAGKKRRRIWGLFGG
jgi:murein L,D-transpeptidase YafK